ncbi:hypothetical protein [Massilia sp. 9096]|uniref:hypothetical protein n=1 Tax=Massilia sp. 9096 TaxID=1500894 RepID=UPI000A7238D0|nr:hypothetical protein [Massilia sp. 9096]
MADPVSKTSTITEPAGVAAKPAPATPAEALSSARQVEELADRLSACADSLHDRVMRDIRRYPGDVPDAEQTVARTLLEAEQELRQRANRLYADAAARIVSSLGQPQQHVIQLTADAAAKIQGITRIGDGIGLVARLLGLAAAAATGQVAPILTALAALKGQLDVIKLHNSPPAPVPAPDAGA